MGGRPGHERRRARRRSPRLGPGEGRTLVSSPTYGSAACTNAWEYRTVRVNNLLGCGSGCFNSTGSSATYTGLPMGPILNEVSGHHALVSDQHRATRSVDANAATSQATIQATGVAALVAPVL